MQSLRKSSTPIPVAAETETAGAIPPALSPGKCPATAAAWVAVAAAVHRACCWA